MYEPNDESPPGLPIARGVTTGWPPAPIVILTDSVSADQVRSGAGKSGFCLLMELS